jgi:large subunit ribosomal protein L15
MLNLGNLQKAIGSTKEKRRVGRGKGSGMGNQATKGHDGQLGRGSKKHPYAGFEGGQMRLIRILPKRGFKNPHRIEFAVVNLEALDKSFNANDEVTYEKMVEMGLVKNFKLPVKVLADGEITKPLTVHAHHFSIAAKEMIEKVGGKAIEVI